MKRLRITISSGLFLLVSPLCFAAGAADVNYDVIVVGAGASGMPAALAAEQGGAKVLLLERGNSIGASQFSRGMTGVDTKMQRERGMHVTKDYIFKMMEDYTHLLFNAKLGKLEVNESANTIDWLNKNGANIYLPKENGQLAHVGNEPVIYHQWNSHDSIAALGKTFQKEGGTIMVKTTGRDLIKNADGSLGGVIAEREDGSKVELHGKAVIVATGGFLGNQKMLDEFGIVGHPMGWLYNDGSGIKMSWKFGAAKKGENITEYHGSGICTPDNRESVIFSDLEPLVRIPTLWVAPNGQRYFDEDKVYDNALVANALVPVGGRGWVIYDQATIDHFMTHETGMVDSFANIRPYLNKKADKQAGPLPQLQHFLDLAVKEQSAYKGNTLEDLAKAAGFDTPRFVQQVKDYNSYVKTGVDEQFGKSKKDLMYSVKKGPFYAVNVTAYNLTTIGGVKVNEKLEAIDTHNHPIPGLYAVGNIAGGLYSDSYMLIEGLTAGFATTSGRMAGINAAEWIKSQK
ncbi:FAD-dependent oxidoreductase [Shewanella yunxiaonensis]|uniref:FAD-dependent oxidoreductase n=1 Tax=Shewanella yunxiaonensis TaxID=2829809 RepID=A0ABX7YWL2_9GAMM|nr:FAD-dependent oxidoreductase [Shewanella yunxiaonensis]QUN07092.1 FAD-dependent oxidoreductase [Shewanella yunxiaonensis]